MGHWSVELTHSYRLGLEYRAGLLRRLASYNGIPEGAGLCQGAGAEGADVVDLKSERVEAMPWTAPESSTSIAVRRCAPESSS